MLIESTYCCCYINIVTKSNDSYWLNSSEVHGVTSNFRSWYFAWKVKYCSSITIKMIQIVSMQLYFHTPCCRHDECAFRRVHDGKRHKIWSRCTYEFIAKRNLSFGMTSLLRILAKRYYVCSCSFPILINAGYFSIVSDRILK